MPKKFKIIKEGKEYKNNPMYEIVRVKPVEVTEKLRKSDILAQKRRLLRDIETYSYEITRAEEQLQEIEEIITSLGIIEDGETQGTNQ